MANPDLGEVLTERHLKVATLTLPAFFFVPFILAVGCSRSFVNTVLSWGKPKRRSKLQSKLSVTPRNVKMEPDNTPQKEEENHLNQGPSLKQ